MIQTTATTDITIQKFSSENEFSKNEKSIPYASLSSIEIFNKYINLIDPSLIQSSSLINKEKKLEKIKAKLINKIGDFKVKESDKIVFIAMLVTSLAIYFLIDALYLQDSELRIGCLLFTGGLLCADVCLFGTFFRKSQIEDEIKSLKNKISMTENQMKIDLDKLKIYFSKLQDKDLPKVIDDEITLLEAERYKLLKEFPNSSEHGNREITRKISNLMIASAEFKKLISFYS